MSTNIAMVRVVMQNASLSSNRVGNIDALRCFAMSAVIAQHCGLLPFGWIGVWLFFVISGHVVTLSVLERQSSEAAITKLLHFYRRRILRIVPVYYAYLTVGTVVFLAIGARVSWPSMLSLLGFFHNWAMEAGGGELGGWPVAHLWTISVEMQFYALYGCILILMPRRFVFLFLAAALIIAPALRAAVSLWLAQRHTDPLYAAFDIYSGTFLHIDAFAAGALLAFAKQKDRLSVLARPLMGIGAITVILYGIAYVAVNRYVAGAHGVDIVRNIFSGILWGQGRQIILYSAILPATAGAVALAADRDVAVDWLLSNSFLQRVGEISYGGYIFHPLAIISSGWLISKFPGTHPPLIASKLMLFVMAFVFTVTAADLSYRFFETRFTKRTRGTPALATA